MLFSLHHLLGSLNSTYNIFYIPIIPLFVCTFTPWRAYRCWLRTQPQLSIIPVATLGGWPPLIIFPLPVWCGRHVDRLFISVSIPMKMLSVCAGRDWQWFHDVGGSGRGHSPLTSHTTAQRAASNTGAMHMKADMVTWEDADAQAIWRMLTLDEVNWPAFTWLSLWSSPTTLYVSLILFYDLLSALRPPALLRL